MRNIGGIGGLGVGSEEKDGTQTQVGMGCFPENAGLVSQAVLSIVL